jgi:hypothetical protein
VQDAGYKIYNPFLENQSICQHLEYGLYPGIVNLL